METATPTSRRPSAADELIEKRDILCAELSSRFEREGLPRVTGAARGRGQLKQIADECGANFKVTLSNGDYVQVSPPGRGRERDGEDVLTARPKVR
jgi:hypothetical protein